MYYASVCSIYYFIRKLQYIIYNGNKNLCFHCVQIPNCCSRCAINVQLQAIWGKLHTHALAMNMDI